MVDETIQLWSQNPNIEVLTVISFLNRLRSWAKRINDPQLLVFLSSITSMTVYATAYESSFYLHWNFVSMLLSDIFGIQCRSGCMCAGPYSMRYVLPFVDET